MKVFTLFFIFMIGLLSFSTAKEVNPEIAKLVAKNHFKQITNSKTDVDFELVFSSFSKMIDNGTDSKLAPLYYIFNADEDKGFVIVSGDDNASPILGYSTVNGFSDENLPPAFKKLLEKYKKEITDIVTNNLVAGDVISEKWEKLINGESISNNKNSEVGPLLSTTWNQNPYYNDLCPYDYSYNELTVAGCPATAMGQIMKYWSYPETGTGFHSYNHSTYGTLSANFASATYNWSAMPNDVSSTNMEVATLMFHCGVAVDMTYGVAATGGSGGYVIEAASPVQHCVEYALKTYFGYQSSMQGLIRDQYSDSDWISIMKSDLDAGHPIQYAGFGQGGHTFVCDGYDSYNNFHMNWGWGGYYDGFFNLDALNPGTGGTGAGAGTYNLGQQALIGIMPPSGGGGTDYDLSLYDYVQTTANPISYGQGFTVYTDIANWGEGAFYGDFCAAIFDENMSFVENIEVLSGYSLEGGQHFTDGLTFTTAGMLTVLPGSYYIGIFYQPTGGSWGQVGDGSYSNMIPFGVYYANDIELYQDFAISCGTNIQQNQDFTITLDVINDGAYTFVGDFDVSLFNLDGTFAETVQTLSGASLDPGYYYDDIEFVSSGLTIAPGTYLLALMHKEDVGDWQLSGSSYYSNPIFVTIQEQDENSDSYEDNNSQLDAYKLSLSFSNNNASVSTSGSNVHIGSDVDFYKIGLPIGYEYTISARVHDAYNSGNGQNYSCDVVWAYLVGENWSDSYDDVMPSAFVVNGGGSVYFNVAPYFAGETGTYLLSIDVSRRVTGVDDVSDSELITLFPNPAKDVLYLEVDNNVEVENIKIFDIVGKEMIQIEDVNSLNHTISIEDLPFGAYMMMIQTDKRVLQHKFIKSE